MTDCLTQIKNKRGSISSGTVHSILQIPHRNKLTKQLQYQGKGTEVDARTVELYSKQGNSDIPELIVIDENDALRKEKNTTQKESPSAHVE